MISLERNFIYTLAKLENESYNEMFNKETFEYMRDNVYYNEPENYDLWLTSEIKNFENGLEWALNYMEKRCVSLLGFKFFKYLIDKNCDYVICDIDYYIENEEEEKC